MGLGSTAKKVQRLSNLAEKLYEKVNEVLERLSALHERVERASEDVQAVRREQREQRAILEALAEEQGVDVEAVVADLEGWGAEETTGETDEGEPTDELDEQNAAERDEGTSGDAGGTEAPADAS